MCAERRAPLYRCRRQLCTKYGCDSLVPRFLQPAQRDFCGSIRPIQRRHGLVLKLWQVGRSTAGNTLHVGMHIYMRYSWQYIWGQVSHNGQLAVGQDTDAYVLLNCCFLHTQHASGPLCTGRQHLQLRPRHQLRQLLWHVDGMPPRGWCGGAHALLQPQPQRRIHQGHAHEQCGCRAGPGRQVHHRGECSCRVAEWLRRCG
jgi:hypothetical protein